MEQGLGNKAGGTKFYRTRFRENGSRNKAGGTKVYRKRLREQRFKKQVEQWFLEQRLLNKAEQRFRILYRNTLRTPVQTSTKDR